MWGKSFPKCERLIVRKMGGGCINFNSLTGIEANLSNLCDFKISQFMAQIPDTM
jgi:hypothetical protein